MPSVVRFLPSFFCGSLRIAPCTCNTLLPKSDSLNLITNFCQYNMAFSGMVRGFFRLIIPTDPKLGYFWVFFTHKIRGQVALPPSPLAVNSHDEAAVRTISLNTVQSVSSIQCSEELLLVLSL